MRPVQEFICEHGFVWRAAPRFWRLIEQALAEGGVLDWPPLTVPVGLFGLRVLCSAVIRHPDLPNDSAAGHAARAA
jgi:hypothetical protein